ncbi:hypothetical protein HPB52_002174 [Rhipicephalus sanguineus]|uniref:Uncharacterized protein n=1 Tax=Rhipicephalus sanguineus TaxID=34632 RepID=A0A9D4T765_RHISA|nr:hypothetical protein HPB52_002174 [Rhipicephalus sanguineus]
MVLLVARFQHAAINAGTRNLAERTVQSHHHVVQEGLIKEAAPLQVASCLANSHMGHLCSHSSKQLQTPHRVPNRSMRFAYGVVVRLELYVAFKAGLELDSSHPWGPMVCLAMGDLGLHLHPPAWSVSSSLCQHSSRITNR